MNLFVTTTVGLVIWIVLWSLGAKAIDALLIPLLMVIGVICYRLAAPHLPGNKP